DAIADLGGAAGGVAILEAAALLLAQRGGLERLQMPVELLAVEARDRVLARAAGRHGALGRGLRGRPVAPHAARGPTGRAAAAPPRPRSLPATRRRPDHPRAGAPRARCRPPRSAAAPAPAWESTRRRESGCASPRTSRAAP